MFVLTAVWIQYDTVCAMTETKGICCSPVADPMLPRANMPGVTLLVDEHQGPFVSEACSAALARAFLLQLLQLLRLLHPLLLLFSSCSCFCVAVVVVVAAVVVSLGIVFFSIFLMLLTLL